jgi:hypothetical protein
MFIGLFVQLLGPSSGKWKINLFMKTYKDELREKVAIPVLSKQY